MPTFERIERVKAEQFTGGLDGFTMLKDWVRKYDSRVSVGLMIRPDITPNHTEKYYFYLGDTPVPTGGWVIRNQEGFLIVTNHHLNENFHQIDKN